MLHVVERKGTPLLYVLETRIPVPQNLAPQWETPPDNTPLPDDAFKALVVLRGPLNRMKAGEKKTIMVSVTNISATVWPLYSVESNKYGVRLGNHWLDENGGVTEVDYDRGDLFEDLPPGGQTELKLNITAPSQSGRYVLEVDMVQEHVSWFALRGSSPLRIAMQIE